MGELPSFKRTKEESGLINKIAKRATRQMRGEGVKPPMSQMDLEMDLAATHANGNPLDFAKLLAADDFDFAHDICGIIAHINRKTGRLRNCFVPRCSIKG